MKEIITLEKHLRILTKERDKRFAQRFKAQEKATTRAWEELKEKLVLLNELRGNVATKDQMDAIEIRMMEIVTRLDKTEGRSGGFKDTWGVLVSVAIVSSAIAGLFSHFIFK